MLKNKLLNFNSTGNLNKNTFHSIQFYLNIVKYFTGKTETGFKFTTPKMRMKSVKPIFPPPGESLQIPTWTPKYFCERIGGDCHEVADKFETLEEIFTSKTEAMKAKGVPVKQRKYILGVVDKFRRGLLTWEYIQSRTTIKPCRKLTISAAAAKGGKKDEKKDKK